MCAQHADEQGLIDDARAVGARVVGFGRIPGPDGRPMVTARVIVEDGWQAARLLQRRCDRDARDPFMRELAASIASGIRSPRELGETLQRTVQHTIAFVPEKVETFQRARFTWLAKKGDCDDHVRVLYPLAKNARLPVRLDFLQRRGQPAHVFASFGHDGAWHAAETTIAALYGEPPIEAARRLGISTRPDLDGESVALESVSLGLVGTEAPPTKLGGSWRNDPAWVRWAARLFARSSPETLGPAAIQAALAVAAYETGIGRNLPGWNFGGVMNGGAWKHDVPETLPPIVCPADGAIGKDYTHPDGRRRWVCFQKWPTPEEGARSWLKTLLYHAGSVIETGDADAIASEMYRPKGGATGYFGNPSWSGSQNVRTYAAGLEANAQTIARLLGEPHRVKRAGPVTLALGLGVVVAAVAVALRRPAA